MHPITVLTTLSVTAASAASIAPRQAGTHTMGFIGCSMAENVAQGYVANKGTHMWGPYGTGGLVVQSWTSTNSAAWKSFDAQVAKYGKPSEVWVQLCIFAQQGVSWAETQQLIANTRQHAIGADTKIYITGQPIYPEGNQCFLAGAKGPEATEEMAKRAAADPALNVTYPGAFKLLNKEVQDGCHANTAGQASLGKQALAFWG